MDFEVDPENLRTVGVAEVSVEELRRQFQHHPIAGLKEVKVIGRGGAVIDIYP